MTAADLEKLVENRISKHGVHLIDLVIKGEGKRKSVEVYIDSELGITTKVCSDVSRDVQSVMSSAGIVQDHLTVSSPGTSRSLRHPWQYKKHMGRQLLLRIHTGDGEKNVLGSLISVDETGIVLTSGKESKSITFESIAEARVKTPW